MIRIRDEAPTMPKHTMAISAIPRLAGPSPPWPAGVLSSEDAAMAKKLMKVKTKAPAP